MKYIIIGLLFMGATACTDSSNDNSSNNKQDGQTQPLGTIESEKANGSSVRDVVHSYIKLKNALAEDNSNSAAEAGREILDVLANVDQSPMTADQKRKYEELADDVKENAEHISANAGKIDHQREHFEMLSKDVYDLVKTSGAGQQLYKDFCPMYNNNKGAMWISEVKEIQNPYLGKEMPHCGEIKEEIK